MRFASLLVLSAALSLSAGEFKLGHKVSDFSLQDVKGQEVSFASLKGPVTVITFVSVQCPVSNAYNERMSTLYKQYSSKGVRFVFVNSNRAESAADVEQHAAKSFPFAVHKDNQNVVADRFGATVTPESFVLDKDGTVVYHGALDDSQEASRAKEHRLKTALDEVLAGKAVTTAQTKAFGCSIKRVNKES